MILKNFCNYLTIQPITANLLESNTNRAFSLAERVAKRIMDA
jgi:hypothetical protein